MRNFLILIFMLSLASVVNMANAQDFTQTELYGQPKPEKLSIPQIRKKKDTLYFSDELLKDFDPNAGIIKDSYFTMRDRNRFSLGYHLSTNYNDFTEITTFELEFLQNMRDWQNAWWGLIFKSGSATFEAITQNHDLDSSAASGSDANAANQRKFTAAQSFTLFGIGMGHRFRFLLDFVKTQRLYEQIMCYVTYVSNTDDFTDQEYAGPGLTVDYQLFKRSSQRVYYGGKLSYNLASVSKEIPDGVRNREARLTLSWFSLAFNIGYFY